MAGWSNVPAGKTKYDRLTRGGVTKFWSPGLLGLGGSYQTAATLNAQRQKEGLKPIDFTKTGVPKSKPAQPLAAKPPVAPPAAKPDPVAPPATKPPATKPPATKPPATKPPATKPDPVAPPAATTKPPATKTTPTTSAPASVPFGKTMPTPASASLDKFKINKDWAAANPRLAQAEVKKAEQRAAGKSAFSSEFRKTTTNPILYKPGALKQEATMKKEPFDLVLEYLLSEGHTDTLDEALYVMMEMDPETIQSIYEAASDQSDKQIDKGVKTTYKAQNVLDNQHQGRSRGLNRLPASERTDKTKRMRSRLKTRRDDLFGERNKREDDRREKLKKILGL